MPLLNPFVASLLVERGIEENEHERFLFPCYDRDIHDPFLFDDMRRAVSRILHGISHSEKITIYGDYDVDGVTGALILSDVLKRAGAQVTLFFNHREEDGYGLHRHCIDRIAEEGARIVISTDCGIANTEEVAYARTQEIDTIITDHHTPPATVHRIPPALAIIHPRVHADRYPWKHLSGGGSAFKLAQALCRTLAQNDSSWLNVEKWLLDLVALSILSDCVPLQGENRALLHYGLKVITKTRRPGLCALLERVPSLYQSSLIESLQYGVIPLLNAASRMDHASRAVETLCAQDDAAAALAANTLVQLNRERQRLTQKTLRDVPGNILVNGAVFLAASPSWRVGVLGLVANKLMGEYQKPIILVRSGQPCVGVARSTPDIHIAKTFALLRGYFQRYGGHHAAGGFALKSSIPLEEFAEALEKISPVSEECGERSERVAEIRIADFTEKYAQDLSLCEPWGPGNKKPLYRLTQCTIHGIRPIGNRGQWIRMYISQGDSRMSIRARSSLLPHAQHGLQKSVAIMGDVHVREWHGFSEISFTAHAIDLL